MSWFGWLVGEGEDEGEAADASGQDAGPAGQRSEGGASATPLGVPRFARVFVRVYDAAGTGPPQGAGTPALHTGVEVHSLEYSLSAARGGAAAAAARRGSGSRSSASAARRITACRPGKNPDYRLRETLSMGNTRCSGQQVAQIIEGMRKEWEGSEREHYQFVQAFCHSLGVARLPAWVGGLEAPAAQTYERVFVRVYDLGTTFLSRWYNAGMKSFGAFHTGVEVYGHEWSFGMTLNDWSTGVTVCLPGRNRDHSFRETLSMGCTQCSFAQVTQLLNELRREWKGCTYDLFSRNCHHFSNELCIRLGVGPLPAWVNDLATSFASAPEPPEAEEEEEDAQGAQAVKTLALQRRPWQQQQRQQQQQQQAAAS